MNQSSQAYHHALVGVSHESRSTLSVPHTLDLPEALRTGRPQNEVKHGQKGMFEELYSDLPRLEQFMDAMTGISRLNFEAFAEKFDFSKYQTLCDVGGATGLLSIEIAKRHAHLQCISFDLPVVEPIAKKYVAAAGLERSREHGVRRLLQEPATKGRHHYNGHDSARLESGEKDVLAPSRLRRIATGRRVGGHRSTDR